MDLARIEEIIRTVEDSQVYELTIRSDGASVTVRKGIAPAVVVRPAAKAKPPGKPQKQEAPQTESPTDITVNAPMVGIFHSTAPPLGVGSVIKPGQIVGAIESMKLMNEVVAEAGGAIVEIDVEDGVPVEYGQVLLRLEPGEEAR